MSNMEEVEAAETKMITAKDSLLNYIEGRKVIDRGRHQQLVAQLKKAPADFLKAISELGD
jgi:hypothetical protein